MFSEDKKLLPLSCSIQRLLLELFGNSFIINEELLFSKRHNQWSWTVATLKW